MPTTKNNNPFDLTGKYALITGSGTGLGLGMAKAFIEAGAHVIPEEGKIN
jgi:short-subunit dehydrogenase involved in D-alanine esterification of teichoic acids